MSLFRLEARRTSDRASLDTQADELIDQVVRLPDPTLGAEELRRAMSTRANWECCGERTRVVIEMAMTTSTAAAPASHDCVASSQNRGSRIQLV